MKNRILIIEDNFYKYFTTRSILESKLRMNVKVMGINCQSSLPAVLGEISPGTVIYKPAGGVADLLSKLQKRNINRRNSEITLLITPELNEALSDKLADWTRHKKFFAAAA